MIGPTTSSPLHRPCTALFVPASLLPALAVVVLSLTTGCASTAGQWQLEQGEGGRLESEAVATRDRVTAEELGEAKRQHALASDATSLAQAIALFEALLERQPGQADVQVELAEALVLYGAAYETRRADKRRRFIAAQAHAENVLLANAGFRAAMAAGQRPGQAASQLGENDVPAMVIWATATAYLFDEGMSSLGRLRNFRGLDDLRMFMERAMALNPYHEYGLVPFSLAVFHIAAPAIAGGNLERAAELIEQAIDTPGVSLLPRWGRARYLHTQTGDLDALRADLDWILTQDPEAVDSPFRWNVYVQRDARRMLDAL